MLASNDRASHKARALERTHVLGHRVERHGERLRQLGDQRFAARQSRKDRPASRIGECAEDMIEGRWIFNHMVEYIGGAGPVKGPPRELNLDASNVVDVGTP